MLTQILFLVICQTIIADNSVNKPYYDVENETLIRDLFEKFIETNSRNYDGAEKEDRFQIFVESLKEINSLNEKYEATFDVNFFADLRPEEKNSYFGLEPMGPLDDKRNLCMVDGDPTTNSAPASWNWRDQNAVTPIKDQKGCYSCWAFATTALVESRYLTKYSKIVSLSEQQLVDCDDQSNKCKGGLMTTALTKIIEEGGLESSADYPYEAQNGTCRFDVTKVLAKVTSCKTHQLSTENALKELLYKEGPLAISIAASTWQPYQQGVHESCDDVWVNHGVLLIGYGSENGKDYWLIKNSWGTAWGDKGYIKIRRGVNCDNIMFNALGSFVSATVA